MSAPLNPDPLPGDVLLDGIAIIGMSGRFPGARSVAEFWQNQLRGIETISRFRVEELEVSDAAELAKQPNYVRARGVVEDVELFDAEFFGILPKEAELMDPQQRLFLECCWETFENAGYDPAVFAGAIGVFAGSSVSSYFLSRICAQPGFLERFTSGYQTENYPAMMGNNLDFLSTRVSYKFNLRGPSFTLQAGCSTSLLAVCQACQSLLTYQSDMALAGGVSITLPQKRGYFYQDGGMGSADGHTRTFDAGAQGTVFGSGVAVVLLKRLDDALRDGDRIDAVIRSCAVNNDGAAKVGYTAPSVEGQANVIALAQANAGISPSTIGYIEAHGTATPLGDPIELSALTKAFRAGTAAKQFCVLGTAKTNVGHLDIAAGVTGLIHATHIVREGKLPPTLHFQQPSDKFNLADSPFYVNTQLREWNPIGHPRRAGVSAFGVGGTNAHVIVEQAPPAARRLQAASPYLLQLSARSAAALDAAQENLAAYLEQTPSLDLADTAFTLAAGRRSFDHRRILIARDREHAVSLLRARDSRDVIARSQRVNNAGVCFLFPGQGSQSPKMGQEIYDAEVVYRDAVRECARLLQPHLGLDLERTLYPSGSNAGASDDAVTQTILAQPAIFTVEYALAKLWMSWGILPRVMIGHSVGEYVAACLSGVFSLQDALRLIAVRGRLMQALPPGAMLSVRASQGDLAPLIHYPLSIAAVNSPSLSVVSGPFDAIAALEEELSRNNIVHRRLHTSHAFHSAMMDPILEPFTAEVRTVALSAPRLPYLSSVTGDWITAAETTSPEYWALHFRQPVNFSAGIVRLRQREDAILLEAGPGNVLATLARQHPAKSPDQIVVSSLTDGKPATGETGALRQALGCLWLGGAAPDWRAVYGSDRRRVALPTYPFERKRFWLETLPPVQALQQEALSTPQPHSSANAAASVSSSIDQEKIPMTAPAVSTTLPRRQRLHQTLCEIFADLSGVDIAQADENATFLDLGFDSLFLTQVTQALQSKFKLKITFRQLLGEQSTAALLAGYLDEQLPAEAPVSQNTAPAAAPALPAATTLPAATLPGTNGSSSTAGAGTAVEELMRQQLQAMNQLFAQQLATLQGGVQPSAPVAAVTAPAASNGTAARPQPAAAEKPTELKGYTPFKPLQKNLAGELTSQQEKYIANLVGRYTARTAGSKSKTQQYRRVLADPRVVAGFRAQWKEMVYPIITVRSQGSHLWDVDGNEYVDILNGFGPIMLGHRPEFVERAVEKQLHEGFEIGPQTLLAGEVATAICEMTGNERATFCNTGSEAVIAAMRVARTVTGRNKVVYFAGDYHGMFDEVLVKGFKKNGQPQSMPIAPGIPREMAANIIVLEYGAQESLDWIRNNAGELAAILVEPVQSRHPDLQPIGFLKELRSITEESGTCLVFDEVVTGFRVHPGGCQALFGIRADLATYGKVLAGGMPVGVLAGKAKYMDALDGGMWQYGDDSFPETGVTFFAGTFVRHPLAMAACAAVLKHFKEQGPQLQQDLSRRAGAMVGRLNQLLEENDVPTRIENFASIFYFSFRSDFRFGSLFYYHLREKGIHLLEGFPCFLTTEHSDADLERIVRAFAETIAEMQAGGVLPEPTGKRPVAAAAEQEILAVAGDAPLTEAQREVWLASQFSEQASLAFNESFTLHLRGELDEPKLRQSLQQLIDRHDALRATFSPDGRKMRFARRLPLEILRGDLSALAEPTRRDALATAKREESRTAFSLTQGPLVRMRLIRLTAEHHALIFTSHHIVCDGWSTNVLLDELSRLYSDAHAGAATLPGAVSFGDYARANPEGVPGAGTTEVETYWLKEFAEIPPVLNLPVDRPYPAVKSFSGSTLRRHIDRETYDQIRKAGSRQGCTPFVTLLAGFTALLHRLTAQNDIVVGIPTAGQSLLEEGSLVGHCVNFLPLRTRIPEGQTATGLLTQTKRVLLDAYEHQAYTYGTLVRQLKLRRDPSRLPLVEVQFNLEKVGSGLQFPGLTVEVDPNEKSAVNFDLFLNIVESPSGLTLDCDYNTTLFDQETIGRWLGHYETLLRGVAADSQQPIALLPLLNQQELRRMLVEWNDTREQYPRLAVHRLIEEHAARTPEAIAVSHQDRSITYKELDHRANQLARHLMGLGVKPGDLVGIAVERSPEMLVGLLGIWKAGAAYVPLDPAYPEERLSYILGQTAVPVLITQARLAEELPPISGRLLLIDRDWIVIQREPTTAPDLPVGAESSAYVIFTSGSTGQPKGVEVTHGNLANLLYAMKSQPGLGAEDRLLAVTTLSFDIAGLELFLPLITGAQTIVASRETAGDPMLLLDRIAESNINVMQATPATWRGLIESGWEGSPNLKMLCGGEALPRILANQLVARGASLWNMYGPTETTIWSATSRMEEAEGPVTIGSPIANTQFYVLDGFAQPAPIGVPGELYIGGDGVARGYFQRPDLTRERFVPDHFVPEQLSGRPNQTLYRTGDLVRRRADGTLEFLGRIDNQVKIRGFRIELGEIETTLARNPAVAECVVIAREDEPGDKRLVAYLVAQHDERPTPGDLRAWIAKSLPDYMVPSLFVVLPSLPQTPNGKVDRKALPAPNAVNLGRRPAHVAPQTAQQERLAVICAEVLHLDRVSVEESLFDLGADSIHLFQIIARAARDGISISPQQILGFRTVAALAAELDRAATATEQTPAQLDLRAVPRDRHRIRLATPAEV